MKLPAYNRTNVSDTDHMETLSPEFRQVTQLGSKCRARMLKLLCEPLIESLRVVKTNDPAAAGIGLQQIGEASFYSGALAPGTGAVGEEWLRLSSTLLRCTSWSEARRQ